MGIVKISNYLHEEAKIISKAMGRSINSQAEYWMQIGKLLEENPLLTYSDIVKLLIKNSKNINISTKNDQES